MTVEKLIANYRRQHPSEHFFDQDTLAFFGERISEMRVLKETVEVTSAGGFPHTCYVLSSYQQAWGGPHRVYHYFDVDTFEYVIT